MPANVVGVVCCRRPITGDQHFIQPPFLKPPPIRREANIFSTYTGYSLHHACTYTGYRLHHACTYTGYRLHHACTYTGYRLHHACTYTGYSLHHACTYTGYRSTIHAENYAVIKFCVLSSHP